MKHPDLSLLSIGHSVQNADWNWQNVCSPFARIFIVTSGEARLHIADIKLDLHPGCMYIIPPFITHSYECHGKFSLYYLHIYARVSGIHSNSIFDRYMVPVEIDDIPAGLISDIAEICDRAPALRLNNTDPQAYDTNMQLSDFLRRYDLLPVDLNMYIEGIMLSLIAVILRNSKLRPWTHDDEMSHIISYIGNHLSEKISVSDLAQYAHLSPDHFSRRFKMVVGETPLRYINRKRIEHACDMLLRSGLSIKEVAYQTGIDDYSYFIRLFKKITGVTPVEYRHRVM